MISMDEFGQRIARMQDEAIAAGDPQVDNIAQARQWLFVEAPARAGRTKGSLSLRVGIGVLAAAAMILATFAGLRFFAPAPGASPQDAVVADAWISAPADTTRDLVFEDGSIVTLQPATDARVISRTVHGAHVVIENGSARVNVKHFVDTRWLVDVGPYRVNVVGTVFTVAWNAATKEFRLTLDQGRVVVRGPMMEDGRTVQERETLMARVSEGRLEILTGSAENGEFKDVADVAATPPGAPSEALSPSPLRNAKTNTIAQQRTADVTWQQLNRQGQFADVIREAQRDGLARTLKTRSSADLLSLGDAARLQKDWNTSEQAYKSLRSRFAGTEAASTASYSLGRMAFDNQRNYAVAISWLEIYLKENNQGSLAREALGRLMEARSRVGNDLGAKTAAVEYLSRYPEGPHAQLANTLVNRP